MKDGESELRNPEENTHCSFLDEIVKRANKTCTHTHTCNPAGPDAGHTHTCYHTHTRVFSAEEDMKIQYDVPSLKPKSSPGNRVAVRKYREKKKAHTAFLEVEVKRLRALNQQLVGKLQGQVALETELSSLRAHFVNLRGMIDIKLGSLPFQNHCSANSTISFEDGTSIGLQCPVEYPCFGRTLCNTGGVDDPIFSWQENCQPVILESLDCVKKADQ